MGQLTTVVYPGYTLQPGERITIDKLNLLGSPTVVVSGTSTGSVIAAGSITSSAIGTNAFDQLTILGGYNGSSATAIRVNYNTNDFYLFSSGLGYRTNSIENVDVASNAAIAWSKIAPGTNIFAQTNLPLVLTSNVLHANNSNGVPVGVTVGNGLTLSNNTLFLPANYTATNANTLSNGVFTFTHGLGATPGLVRPVLLCTTSNGVFVPGDELDATGIRSVSDSLRLSYRARTNTVTVVINDTSDLRVTTNVAGNVTLTAAHWKLKLYARP